MATQIFTEPWVRAWGEELKRSASYREAARGWEWPVVLAMEADPGAGIDHERSVYLDLWHGDCREARVATPGDLEAATYAIVGAPAVWRRILAGELDPMLALAGGKLKLRKGGLLRLARYTRAAKQMVVAAARMDAGEPHGIAEPVAEAPHQPTAPTSHSSFATTSGRGLRYEALPMRLYQKAKRLGIWDPQDIDFTRDSEDWARLDSLERTVILHLTSQFQAGEESVTLDLLPLMMVIAREKRLEEEIYLTTFLWEEAKHTEFFRRFLDEVAGETGDLSRFHGPDYRRIFYDELPAAMNALLGDASPAAQIRASVTYNMIVEGTLAETGYHAYQTMLERNQLMPGLCLGIGQLRRDESRHIAYGLYLLSRLVAADRGLWALLEERMGALLDPALGVIREIFDAYDSMPFGLVIDEFLDYALGQFQKRMSRLEQARDGALDALPAEVV